MKLAPLLAEYLFTNKQLSLPGVGTFQMEEPVPADPDDRKQQPLPKIAFLSDPSTKETTELVRFISEKTGKMKALAASDLNSFLEIMHQFLNLGEPFMIDGIGNLVKLHSGQYDFSQGKVVNEKIKDFTKPETGESFKESIPGYSKTSRSLKSGIRYLLPILLAIAGIVVAVWAGYKIYQKKASGNHTNTTQATDRKIDETVPYVEDRSTPDKKPDSIKKEEPVTIQKPAKQGTNYKFVIEEANKERALSRFTSLKSWGLPIQLETADSINFKLFFILNSTASDTSKTLDSLKNLYTPYWSKSYVER